MRRMMGAALALLLALGMAAPALAASTVEGVEYDARLAVDGIVSENSQDGVVPPGETAYFVLEGPSGYVKSADDVKNITIKQTWEIGKDLVDSVSILRKKYEASGEYIYFLVIALKETSVTPSELYGSVQLRRTTSPAVDVTFNVSLEIKYPPATELEVTDVKQSFFGSDSDETYGLTGEQTILLPGEDNYFEANLTGQGKLVMWGNNDVNSVISARYPAAELTFLNTNGVTFNKTGTLYIGAENGSYLYAISSVNTLSQIKNAYFEDQDSFVFSTRTIGSYVISDIPLTGAAASSSYASSSSSSPSAVYSSGNTPNKPNPGTGAAA